MIETIFPILDRPWLQRCKTGLENCDSASQDWWTSPVMKKKHQNMRCLLPLHSHWGPSRIPGSSSRDQRWRAAAYQWTCDERTYNNPFHLFSETMRSAANTEDIRNTPEFPSQEVISFHRVSFLSLYWISKAIYIIAIYIIYIYIYIYMITYIYCMIIL